MTITGRTSCGILVILIVVPLLLISTTATADFIPSEAIVASEMEDEPRQSSMAKRPFCNAFTGCGRKRSEPDDNKLPTEFDDLFLNKLGQQILRAAKQRASGFQAKMARPKVALRLPYLEFPAERKRRMAQM